MLRLELDAGGRGLLPLLGESYAPLGDDPLGDHPLTALEVLDESLIGLLLGDGRLGHPGQEVLVGHPPSEHVLPYVRQDHRLDAVDILDVGQLLALEPSDGDLAHALWHLGLHVLHGHAVAVGVDRLDGDPLGKSVLHDGVVGERVEPLYLLRDLGQTLGLQP